MITFRTVLEDKLLAIAQAQVGVGTDSTDFVRTFDNHIHDFNLDYAPNPWPFVVVNVRTAEHAGGAQGSEIGTPYDLYEWTVHIYYIDIVKDYNTGDMRRDKILGKLVKALEENRRLDNLESVYSGTREYVYDSTISAVVFDSSGQEEEYSFQSELYLTVYTAKN